MSIQEQIYDTWAPPGSVWTPWAKPVLFAHLDNTLPPTPQPPPLLMHAGIPAADGQSALVLDLPGEEGVWAGLELAEMGYRPVPLYNACPGPRIASVSAPGIAVVDVSPIMGALMMGISVLRSVRLPDDAPPAFLLDARRRSGSGAVAPQPGRFDNRSISFPTDFPSSNLLLSRGIRSIHLVQEVLLFPVEDIAHTLLRWQEDNLHIFATSLNPLRGPEPVTVPRPRLFRSLLHRFYAMMGLRRDVLGGFGGVIPMPSSSVG
jgi:hypothetical protein